MRGLAIGVAFFLLVTAVTRAAETNSKPTLVTIAQGSLAGAAEDGITSFKDIPFAAPPVGPLRWRAPQAAPNWQGVRAADKFGAICPQQKMPLLKRLVMPKVPESEDCLSLNVWTPNAHPGAKLPVMVWIYGGSFVRGGAALPYYDATDLAKYGVVVVTFNYRLGWLGFFDHPALAAETPNEPHGNYGLMDQIAALEWVKANIAAFGGDPSNVTIFGESAGGMSVNDLMASPPANGLFAKAISESGLGMNTMATEDFAKDAARAFAGREGAKGDDRKALAALRRLSVEKVIDDQSREDTKGPTGPMIDGIIIPAETDALFAAGKIAKVPYLAGSNSNEASLMDAVHTTTADMLKPVGDKLQFVRSVYDPSGKISDDELARAIFNDSLFASAAQGLADYVTKTGEPAYVYQFAYLSEAQRATAKGVNHGGEVPYVFGTRGMLKDPFYSHYVKEATANDLAVVVMMQTYWTNFARTGDPNDINLPPWEPTSPEATKTLLVDDNGTKTVDDFRKAQLALSYAYWSKRTGLPPPN